MSEPHKHGPECREVFALLSEYLDRELPEGDCAEIERHIADCPPCIEFLNSLKRSIELCHGYAPKDRPAPFQPCVKEDLYAAWQKTLSSRK